MKSYQSTTQAKNAQYAVRYTRRESSQRTIYLQYGWGKINADVNAALNIARRIGYEIRVMRNIESYLVTHNGVKPLIPNRRGKTP